MSGCRTIFVNPLLGCRTPHSFLNPKCSLLLSINYNISVEVGGNPNNVRLHRTPPQLIVAVPPTEYSSFSSNSDTTCSEHSIAI